MEEAKDEGMSKEYVAANRMKHKSLFKLIEKNLIMGTDNAISSAISDKLAAKAMRFKETFDPMNMLSALPIVGNYAAHKYGESTGRSSEDMHYFTGYGNGHKPEKAKSIGNINKSAGRVIGNLDTASYTSMNEGKDQKFRRGDGVADLLARQLNLFKKYHNEEIKHIEELQKEDAKRRVERAAWEKNLIKAALGGGKDTGEGGPDASGVDPLSALLGAGATATGVAGRYAYKRVKNYLKSKKIDSKIEPKPQETAKKVEESTKEPIKKETTQKLRSELTDSEFAAKRTEELRVQKPNLNREQRRAQVRKDVKERRTTKKPTATKVEAPTPTKPIQPITETPKGEVTPKPKVELGKNIPKGGILGALMLGSTFLDKNSPTGFSLDFWTQLKEETVDKQKYGMLREAGFGLVTGLSAGASLATYSGDAGIPRAKEEQEISEKFKNFDKSTLNSSPQPIPQPNSIAKTITKTIDDNRKVKNEESNSPVKVNVIDKSKTLNNVSTSPDTVSYGSTFNVRNIEDTFAWVSNSNTRQV